MTPDAERAQHDLLALIADIEHAFRETCIAVMKHAGVASKVERSVDLPTLGPAGQDGPYPHAWCWYLDVYGREGAWHSTSLDLVRDCDGGWLFESEVRNDRNERVWGPLEERAMGFEDLASAVRDALPRILDLERLTAYLDATD